MVKKSASRVSCREKENVNNGSSVDVLREEKKIGEMSNAKSLTGGRGKTKCWQFERSPLKKKKKNTRQSE